MHHNLAFYEGELQLELHLILLIQELSPPFEAKTSLLYFFLPLTSMVLDKSYTCQNVSFIKKEIILRISFISILSIWLWKAKDYWDVVFHSGKTDSSLRLPREKRWVMGIRKFGIPSKEEALGISCPSCVLPLMKRYKKA